MGKITTLTIRCLVMPARKKRRRTTSKKKKVEPKAEELSEELEEESSKDEKEEKSKETVVEKTPKFTRQQFPEVDELVVAVCTDIQPGYGAYFRIVDYEYLGDRAGFCHISEITRTWVRNIRAHVRPGQEVVARVLRVNPHRGEVDLSMRRVSESQKREKLTELRNEKRARRLLEVIRERLNMNEDEFYEKVEIPILESFPNYHQALLQSAQIGPEVLEKTGIDKEIAKAIHDLTSKEYEKSGVELIGIITTSVYSGQGAKILRQCFEDAYNEALKVSDEIKIEMAVEAAPRYRVNIRASDWKKAENAWKIIQDVFTSTLSSYDAEFDFQRP